ncbi:MAG: ATP synthase subunit I [Peptostreptococcaceae bacterium]|nr:ATP synthase subunit I [Peptostreptococcaceae bacterium]
MNTDVLWMQFKIVKKSLILMAVLAAVSFFVLKQPKSFVAGMVFGHFISILNFRNMAISLEKAVHMNSGSASVYAAVNYLIRMAIYGVVLYISIKASYIDVLGTVLGFLLIKIVIQSENFLSLWNRKK